jgi:hypothetical protein
VGAGVDAMSDLTVLAFDLCNQWRDAVTQFNLRPEGEKGARIVQHDYLSDPPASDETREIECFDATLLDESGRELARAAISFNYVDKTLKVFVNGPPKTIAYGSPEIVGLPENVIKQLVANAGVYDES